jgi:hypothetical protein
MAPLTTTQVLDRMREVDNDFVMYQKELGDCAAAKVAAEREREAAIAVAYMEASGNSTDRRQAALKAVGEFGKPELIAYAKIAADFELRATRATLLESMLKKASDEDPRFRA